MGATSGLRCEPNPRVCSRDRQLHLLLINARGQAARSRASCGRRPSAAVRAGPPLVGSLRPLSSLYIPPRRHAWHHPRSRPGLPHAASVLGAAQPRLLTRRSRQQRRQRTPVQLGTAQAMQAAAACRASRCLCEPDARSGAAHAAGWPWAGASTVTSQLGWCRRVQHGPVPAPCRPPACVCPGAYPCAPPGQLPGSCQLSGQPARLLRQAAPSALQCSAPGCLAAAQDGGVGRCTG